MADDLARLVVKMEAEATKLHKELDRAKRKISRFERSSRNSMKRVGDSFKNVFAGAAVTIGIAKFSQAVIQTSSSIQQLKVQLETVTGSAKNAESAFDMVQDFASETPFQIQELVAAFVKLKALGLDPSRKALTSYGNTASAMGKSLNQMIEAVADASVFEFERLKEFGIKARQETDKVNLTFQGVTTSVDKNARSVVAFLQGIGDQNFAGAMEKQSKTLAGAFSNLKDSITQALTVEGDSLDQLTGSVVELGDAFKDPTVIESIQTLGKGIVWLSSKALSAGSAITNFTANLSEDFARIVGGAADAESALKNINAALGMSALKGGGEFNLSGLLEDFTKLEKILAISSLEEIEQGLEAIRKQRKQFEAVEISDNVSLKAEKQVLKDLRELYLDARDAKQQFEQSTDNVVTSKDSAPAFSDDEIKALEKYEEKMRKLGQKMTDNIDPQAKFNAQIRELNDLRATGSITQEIYNQKLHQYQDTLAASQQGIQSTAELNKALTDSFSGQDQAIMRVRDRIEALNKAMDQFPERADEITQAIKRLEKEEKDLSKNTDSTTKQMQSLSENAARNMQSAFADFLFDPFDKGLDGMLKSFLRVMQRLLAERLALNIFSGLTSLGPAPTTNAPIVDSLPSMDGGGFTGGGSRMGGLDGRGGFLAMLHPQETVMDHTKGQSQAVSVNFTIQANDTKGFDELLTNRRGLITRMVNDAMNNSGKASLV